MSAVTVPTTNNLPLSLEDVIGLQSDLEVLETVVTKFNKAEFPPSQAERIKRIHGLLQKMRDDKSLRWFKYKDPELERLFSKIHREASP